MNQNQPEGAFLHDLLYQLLRNISLNRDTAVHSNITSVVTADPADKTTAGLADQEALTLVLYVGIFFLWYGGLIFGCLVGLGVYNKRHQSYTLYQR